MAVLADKSADTRNAAFEIADKLPPQELDFPVIEAYLKDYLSQSGAKSQGIKHNMAK